MGLEFNVILYIVFSLIFALITFGIVRYIMKNKKLDKLHGAPISITEKREKAAQERAAKITKKAELRESIKSKKAEWKEEDQIFDKQVKENIAELKVKVAESKVKYDELKAAYYADKTNQEAEEEFYAYSKEHERLVQKLRIEKERASLGYKLERWSKRGGRLRRDLYLNRQYYYLVAPYTILFFVFTVLPVVMSLLLSFTYFNLLEFPSFVGWENYMRLFVDDKVFIIAIRNTLLLAVVTGPLSYIMAFVFAWLINELPPKLRSLMTLIFYAPSISGNVYLVWKLIFSSDIYGYANSFLMQMGIIQEI